MTEKFDPRFDPRYQPGYHDESGGRPAKAEAAKESPPPTRISPTPTGDEPTGGEAFGHKPPGGTAVADPTVEGAVTSAEPEPVPELEPNPFDRALWVVAAVLVVGGVAIAIWANGLSYMGDGSDWSLSQMIRTSAWALSSPMVTVGLATAVGLLFRRALLWKPQE